MRHGPAQTIRPPRRPMATISPPRRGRRPRARSEAQRRWPSPSDERHPGDEAGLAPPSPDSSAPSRPGPPTRPRPRGAALRFAARRCTRQALRHRVLRALRASSVDRSDLAAEGVRTKPPKAVTQAWWPTPDGGGCGSLHCGIVKGGNEKLDELRTVGHRDGRRRPAHVPLPVAEDHDAAIGMPRSPQIRAVVAEVLDEYATSGLSLRHQAQYGPFGAAALRELPSTRPVQQWAHGHSHWKHRRQLRRP